MLRGRALEGDWIMELIAGLMLRGRVPSEEVGHQGRGLEGLSPIPSSFLCSLPPKHHAVSTFLSPRPLLHPVLLHILLTET